MNRTIEATAGSRGEGILQLGRPQAGVPGERVVGQIPMVGPELRQTRGERQRRPGLLLCQLHVVLLAVLGQVERARHLEPGDLEDRGGAG